MHPPLQLPCVNPFFRRTSQCQRNAATKAMMLLTEQDKAVQARRIRNQQDSRSICSSKMVLFRHCTFKDLSTKALSHTNCSKQAMPMWMQAVPLRVSSATPVQILFEFQENVGNKPALFCHLFGPFADLVCLLPEFLFGFVFRY